MQLVQKTKYSLLCELIRRKVTEDVRAYKQQRILNAVSERKSAKKCRRNLMLYENKLSALRDENGMLVTSREGMEEICKNFFIRLLALQKYASLSILPPSHEPLPPTLISEVLNAIHQMEEGKAPRKNGKTAEFLETSESS